MYKSEEEFIKEYNSNNYEKISMTTDVLLLSISDEEQSNYRKTSKKHMSVLLIKRDDYPYKDKWSLPGGFLDIKETLEECSNRVLKRETGLKDIYLEQLYTFSSINRDPRMRIVSTSYMALIDKNRLTDKLNQNASWFNIKYFDSDDEVLVILDNQTDTIKFKIDKKDNTIKENNDLAFDHPLIIWTGIERLKNKVNYTDVVFNMMPELFTLGELQQVYEVILNKKLLDPAFRRIIASKVKKTDILEKGVGHRPSYLFKYKNND